MERSYVTAFLIKHQSFAYCSTFTCRTWRLLPEAKALLRCLRWEGEATSQAGSALRAAADVSLSWDCSQQPPWCPPSRDVGVRREAGRRLQGRASPLVPIPPRPTCSRRSPRDPAAAAPRLPAPPAVSWCCPAGGAAGGPGKGVGGRAGEGAGRGEPGRAGKRAGGREPGWAGPGRTGPGAAGGAAAPFLPGGSERWARAFRGADRSEVLEAEWKKHSANKTVRHRRSFIWSGQIPPFFPSFLS